MTYETREPGRIGARGYALMVAAAVGLAALVLHQFAALLGRPEVRVSYATGKCVEVVDHKAHPSREAFDAALAGAIDAHRPDLVVLAGFMRVLTDAFVEHYAGRLLNIHPSLLPSFPGLHTHRKALEAGVRVHGATVHFVTPTLDCGPVVIQAAVPVLPGDDETVLAARVLEQEHRIYPQAVRGFVEGRLSLVNGRVLVRDEPAGPRGWTVPPVEA